MALRFPRLASEPEPPDDVLIGAIVKDGSESACRMLYQRHTGRIYRLALRLVGSESDAEDVVQEVWLRAGIQLRTFEGRSQLGTWLCGFAVNVSREFLARRGRSPTDELTDLDVLPVAEEPIVERLDIERAVAMLPFACRAAFLLHDVEGFTHEEIAERLGWVAGTSKTQVFRARRALRRMLGDSSGEEAHSEDETRSRRQ